MEGRPWAALLNHNLAFMKATVHVFVISITCALFSVDWPKSVSKSFKNTILPSSVFFPLSASNN